MNERQGEDEKGTVQCSAPRTRARVPKMGCGSSAPVSDDHPISIKKDLNLSTIFEARESMERQDSIAAKKLAQEIQESLDKEKEKKDAEGYASKLEGAAEIAAAGAVAGAMATAAATAVVNSDANLQNAPEELVKVTGEALLEMAKTVPFVAPVAYLIGAIASSAVTAVTLKADCVEFGKIVQMLEKILLKAENLESHEEVVEDVKGSLEEALMLMQKMQDRGIIAATFLAKSDKSKFEDLKVRIEEAINRLNLSVTVDTAAITKAKFQQSEELRKKVEELGGPEALETNPEAAKELEQHMEASDQILSANINAARKSLKAVGEEVVKSNKVLEAMSEQQQIHMKETRKSIQMQEEEAKKLADLTNKMKEEHGEKLDEMTNNFMKVQQEAELQRLQNEMLKKQVDELKVMLTDVRDCMTKFPVPPREPERLLLVNSGGLLTLDKKSTAKQVISEACKEIVERWGVCAIVNTASEYNIECMGGYMPTLVDSLRKMDGKECMSCSVDICGFKGARRASPCAQVIASENTICYSGQNDKPASLLHKPEEVALLAKTDPAVAQQLKAMQEGANFFSSLEVDDETKDKLQNVMMSFLSSETTFYCGCPVKCEGITVASVCCFGLKAPDGWCDKDVKAVEAIADKIGTVLEKEAQAKKFEQAQQAMMQQMMMMQQMQGGVPMSMPGMMPVMPMATSGMMPMMPMMPMTMPGMQTQT